MTLTRSFIRDATTTPLDARLMLASLIVQSSAGVPRPGVLDPVSSILATKATMHVQVNAAEFVTSKGAADGVAIFTNDGNVDVAIGAAPVSNSRIDVIYVKHNDNTTGDGDALPVFGVLAGTAAASPTKPGPLPTGALELGTIRIYSGTVSTNGGSNLLTPTHQMTALRGAAVPFRTAAERNAWTDPIVGQRARTLDATPDAEWDGTAWRTIPGSVFGMRQSPSSQSISNASITKLAVNTNSVFTGGAAVATNAISVPVAGWYRVSGYCLWDANGTGTRVLTIRVNDADPSGYLLRDVTAGISGSPVSNSTSGLIYLGVGHEISMWGTQSSGGSLGVTEKQLSVELVLAA